MAVDPCIICHENHAASACGVPPLTAYLWGRQRRPDDCGTAAAPRSTTAPAELVEFLGRMKALRMRQGKGEFVASDGTRMPYDFVFERDEKPARKGDDE